MIGNEGWYDALHGNGGLDWYEMLTVNRGPGRYNTHNVGGVLLPAPHEEPAATEVELDAEYEAIMSFLDNLDEEQATELDDVATRARNGLGSPADEQPR